MYLFQLGGEHEMQTINMIYLYSAYVKAQFSSGQIWLKDYFC